MTKTIPLKRIETPRMVIRQLKEEDVPNIYGIMSDYETASRTGFRPLSSTSEAEGFIRESIRSGSAHGMTLKDKPDDIFGIVLLTPEELENGAGACTRTVEIGYFMRADMRGNGYMPEAVDAVKDYLFKVIEVDKLIIRVFPENHPSRRVVGKCGFSFDGLVTEAGENGATGKIENLECYSLSRADYYSGNSGKGMNVGYDEAGRSKAVKDLGDGDILPFRKGAFDEFLGPFVRNYSAFEVTKEGQNDIQGCAEELRLKGFHDGGWHFLTSVSVSSAATWIVRHPSAVFVPLETCVSYEDMHRISVGVDPALPEGAVRVRVIMYLKDRWPLPEELDYCKAVVEDTCAEMTRKRGVALSKLRELSRLELKNAAVKDFMSDNGFPGEMYRSKDWLETVRKMRQLLSSGYRLDDAIWLVVNRLCLDMIRTEEPFDFGCAESLIRWLKAEGAKVNLVRNAATPLDELIFARESFLKNKAGSAGLLSGIGNLIDTVKELGGETVSELCTAGGNDMGSLLGVLYPWVEKENK